ncbi:hypothetical protein SS50377_23363 [Spironucleus salmonicida]|uniref:Uncharacterized protein n=1 Tax=Spironucleus salmonicida TaxID=348837 RepID=V6M208_9EUKA|nr:hypothetical protein SS50377_23363 [Spironucleus salmonicida]|eukprot:EST47234.1 Hypothetical protein SS50377_12744 [Spironucleus salmonicida]
MTTFQKNQLVSDKKIMHQEINYFNKFTHNIRPFKIQPTKEVIQLSDKQYEFYKRPLDEKLPVIVIFYEAVVNTKVELVKVEIYDSKTCNLINMINIIVQGQFSIIDNSFTWNQKQYDDDNQKIDRKQAFSIIKQICSRKQIYTFSLSKTTNKLLKNCACFNKFQNIQEVYQNASLVEIARKLNNIEKDQMVTEELKIQTIKILIHLYGEEHQWYLFQLFEDDKHARNYAKLQEKQIDFYEF